MTDKNFKVKSGLTVPSLSTAGVVKTDSSGVITSSATLGLSEGGTGQTTAANALNALLPLQTNKDNYYLQTNGVSPQWNQILAPIYSNDEPSSPEVGQIWVESDSSSDSFDPNIIRRKSFTATAGQTVFTTDLEFIQGYEQVFFNGMLLLRNSDYTTASNTNVTLASGAAAGDIVEVVSITNLNSIDAATTGANTFTGTQTIAGNLAVGTTSPDARLTIQESGDSQLTLKNSSGVTKSYIGTKGAIGSASTDDLRIRSDASNIVFGFSGFEKMRITSTGNVYIGTTDASAYGAKLSVANVGQASIFMWNAGQGSGHIGFPASGSTMRIVNTYADGLISNGVGIDITSSGNIGIGNNNPLGKLQITVPSTERLPVLGTAYGSLRLVGSTNAWGLYMGLKDDSGAGSLQVMRGDSTVAYDFFLQPVGGNTIIGYSSSQGSYKLQVNSQIFATSSSIATSDGRYKENVDTITGGLNIIDSLRPVSFTWKDHPIHNFVSGKTVGFIAQEVQEALSNYDWVDNVIKSNYNEETEEEFLGIAESNIIPLLVAAVKELKARVETLEAN